MDGVEVQSLQMPAYRTHPVHAFPWLEIGAGHEALTVELQRRIEQSAHLDPTPAVQAGLIVIDGFIGLEWSHLLDSLRAAFARQGISARLLATDDCFLPSEQIDTLLASTLTADPVFGRIFHGRLEELWDPARAAALRREIATRDDLTIVYGFGASCLAEGGIQVYVDVSKACGQERAIQARIANVGANAPRPFGATYKRLYFVDWPMLNRIKRAMLPTFDLFVDGSDAGLPLFVPGDSFRCALHELSQQPFRLKPWFAPGPWGGQWMKHGFGLPPEEPNYAWSFELIAPENGLLLGNGVHALECSFDLLLWQETDAVMGASVAARYGSYFPIRFDYLDTMGGTNLSCQVHPRLDYIRDEFGEPFTQDETYYILDCKPGSLVFLGLRDEAQIEQFRTDATAARDQGIPFDIGTYISSFPSAPHDLFLIPSGTVHCSGADNLVLEISATPYIYTFKIYDYLRRDLQGELRHVHLDHAFANIDPTRRETWVESHLRPAPTVIRQGRTWSEQRIGTIDQLFFAIHRLEFEDSIADQTDGRFLILNLVEGESCEVLTASGAPRLHFAETLIVPADVGSFTLRNTGSRPCKVIKAFVKT